MATVRQAAVEELIILILISRLLVIAVMQESRIRTVLVCCSSSKNLGQAVAQRSRVVGHGSTSTSTSAGGVVWC